MYVTRVPDRSSPPAVLLRESYRDGGKVRAADNGPLQLSLFDERDGANVYRERQALTCAEIASPDYPGERLIVCPQ